MGVFVVLPIAIWAAFAQIQVTSTDRAPFDAQLLAISDSAVEVKAGTESTEVAISKLRKLNFSGRTLGGSSSLADSSANVANQATLGDGSSFGYSTFTLSDGQAHFQLLGSPTVLQIPAAELHRVQFQPLSEPQFTQWQAISQSRTAGDILVLIRSEEALEKLEGVVQAIASDQVSFDFGGQVIPAPLSKLAGVRFFSGSGSATRDASAKLAAIVRDRSGGRWMATAVRQARGTSQLEVQLQVGASLTLPIDQVAEIDFSSGSMQFLADLEPLDRQSTKRIVLAIDIPGGESLFGSRPRDLSRPGEPALGPSLEFLGSGSATYRIPSGFSRLRGEVELKPSGSRFTPCQASVQLENQVVWQERLNETGKRLPIDVEIKPEGRLRIEVTAEAETPVGDVVLWHDLRFVK